MVEDAADGCRRTTDIGEHMTRLWTGATQGGEQMNKPRDGRDPASGAENSVPPPMRWWLGWPHCRERAGDHSVGRDTGADDGAEDLDTDPDLLDNGSTIGG